MVATFGIVALTSCKKDWSCICTSASDSSYWNGDGGKINAVPIDKKTAQTACDNSLAQAKQFGAPSDSECKAVPFK